MGDRYYQQDLAALEELNTAKWAHFHARVPVEVTDKTETEALKIKLWNKNHCGVDLDNLIVNVEATPRVAVE